MAWGLEERLARRFKVSEPDQRGEFARDRDRILYSSAFHRLAGVTQIVQAGEEDVFHTRQQHTYKVAQIGRRIAEYLVREHSTQAERVGIHPEVVEAACLAHDIGHPPFGHAAEKELDRIVQEAGLPEGFEGNAQTFRILTKLAVRYGPSWPGLDLTRATLAATLKYPWHRDKGDTKKADKWSAYESEAVDFGFAVEFLGPESRSAEAALMDWSDDIAYSVHDLEDFHRAGIIPWPEILSTTNEDSLIQAVLRNWFNHPADAAAQTRDAIKRFREIFKPFPAVTDQRYDGSREQRRQIRNLTSILIGKYVRSVGLVDGEDEKAVWIERESAVEVRLLKQLARQYVIGLPALHAQQMGQRRVVRDLFKIFLDIGKEGKLRSLPKRLALLWEQHNGDHPARIACDSVVVLTENEAMRLHARLTGIESGSILDPIVR